MNPECTTDIPFKCPVCKCDSYSSLGSTERITNDDCENWLELYACNRCTLIFCNPASFSTATKETNNADIPK